MDQRYTLKQIMDITGVSKRTLHYYDKIGLLPTLKKENGYRHYRQEELIKLQGILFLKALHFSIKDIKTLIKLDDKELRPILKDHQSKLRQQIEALQEKDEQLSAFLEGRPLTELVLDMKPLTAQYQTEADIRYRDQASYQIYLERLDALNPEEREATTQKREDRLLNIFRQFSRLSSSSISSQAVAQTVSDWKAALLTISAFDDTTLKAIAKTYSEDKRFRQYFDQFGQPELADFISRAISHHL